MWPHIVCVEKRQRQEATLAAQGVKKKVHLCQVTMYIYVSERF